MTNNFFSKTTNILSLSSKTLGDSKKNPLQENKERIEDLKFNKQRREYVKKIVQTLASKPESFSAILDLAENPWIALNPIKLGAIAGKFAGTRLELISLANHSSTIEPIHAILLQNGLLEELTSLKTNQVNNIIIEIFKHNSIKTELSKAGIEASHTSAIINNLDLAINLTSTLKDHSIIPQLGSTLSKIIITNKKINASKEPSEKQALSQLQEQNIDTLKNIALNIFAIQETRQAANTLINSSLNTFADIVDNNNLSKEKKETIISLQELDKKITNEKDIKLKDKLTKTREELAQKNKITLIDELTFLSIKNLGLNEKVNFTSLLSSSKNIITNIMDQQAELSKIAKSADKIQKFLYSGKNLEETAKEHSIDIANIVDAGIKILSKEEIIKGITNEKFNNNLQQLDSSPDLIPILLDETKKAIKLIAQDSVFDAITKNQNNLKNILELALSTELTEEQKKNKTPEDITKEEESLKKNKALASEGAELFCEHPEYFINITQTIINNPETKTALTSFQNYSKTPEEKKIEEFKTFINKSLSLLNSPETEKAIFTGLDKVIDSAYQKPNLRKELSFLKDDLTLVKDTLLKEIMPNLLNYAKQAGNNKQIVDLLAEAKDIIKEPSDSNKKPEIDLTKLKSVTKQAIKLYANPQNSKDITKDIETNKIPLNNLIDKSLSLLNKNNIGLKLLKPLGINGDFIQKMLVKINTKEGLEAIEKCIEKQNISNILGLLSATKSRSFVLGHITKSLISYMFSPKNKEKNWTKFAQEDRNNQKSEKIQL